MVRIPNIRRFFEGLAENLSLMNRDVGPSEKIAGKGAKDNYLGTLATTDQIEKDMKYKGLNPWLGNPMKKT